MFSGIIDVLSHIWYLLWIYIPGWALTIVSRILVIILSYQNFANEDIINRGWVVTRDFSNMLFIIVLLVIALGTILRSGRYGYQQNLRRLVLMAILINFSKSIALFFIEVSQVVTLAFVNAFLNSLQAGFPELLGLTPVLQLVKGNAGAQVVGGLSVFVQIMLGGIMMVIALIVIVIITLLFLYRIIAFGFIIILAPIAFLLSAWPTGFTYYQRWWKELGNYTAVGPALAFFLWLSFSVVQQPTASGCLSQIVAGKGQDSSFTIQKTEEGAQGQLNQATDSAAVTGETACPTPSNNPLVATILRFLVGISLLIGGLTVAKELSVAGGAMANKWSGKLGGALKGMAVGAAATAGMGALAATRGIGSSIAGGVSLADNKLLGGTLGRAGSGALATVKRVGDNKVFKDIAGVATSGPMKYATGAFAYDQILQKAVPAYRQMQTAQTSNFMKQMTSLTDNELERKMGSVNAQEARAAAMTLDKRGHFSVASDIKHDDERYEAESRKKQDLRKKAANIMKGAGPGDPVSDHYNEFTKKYIDVLSPEKQKEKLAALNTSGEFEKNAVHWDWTGDLMHTALDVGITGKQLAALPTKMTKNEKGNFGTATQAAVGIADEGDDVKRMREIRELGAKVDSAHITEYASDEEMVVGTNDDGSEKREALMPLHSLVSKLTPEQAAGIHDDSIEQVAPHLTPSQFTYMARSGDPAKVEKAKIAALTTLESTLETAKSLAKEQQKLASSLFKNDYLSNVGTQGKSFDKLEKYIKDLDKDKSKENEKKNDTVRPLDDTVIINGPYDSAEAASDATRGGGTTATNAEATTSTSTPTPDTARPKPAPKAPSEEEKRQRKENDIKRVARGGAPIDDVR